MISAGYLIILAVVAILAIIWMLASMGFTLQKKSIDDRIEDLRNDAKENLKLNVKIKELDKEASKKLLAKDYNKIFPLLKAAEELSENAFKINAAKINYFKKFTSGLPKPAYNKVTEAVKGLRMATEKGKESVGKIEKYIRKHEKEKSYKVPMYR